MRKSELERLLVGALDSRQYAPRDTPAAATPAAVLAIIHYHGDRPYILLTKRGAGLRSHRSEISFPGGRYSEGDRDLLDTAIRETREEIGISFAPRDVLGSLRPVRTMTSNHYIVPFVTVQDMLPQVRASAAEVEQVLDVPLVETLQSMAPDTEHYHLSKNAYRFVCNGNDSAVVWGATARIMEQLYDILIRPS